VIAVLLLIITHFLSLTSSLRFQLHLEIDLIQFQFLLIFPKVTIGLRDFQLFPAEPIRQSAHVKGGYCGSQISATIIVASSPVPVKPSVMSRAELSSCNLSWLCAEGFFSASVEN